MTINWTALGIVAVVAILATVVFVALLSGGIRLMSVAVLRVNRGQAAGSVRLGGWGLLALAGLCVLYGIYLIVPFLH